MLDIGMPEFVVIAIVALVVLGPERLPEVMRRVGQFYRQARELMAQYTSEAQRMFDEGMREVEDVSSTINSAWQDATTDANQPPPRLRQLPPPLQQPGVAADAGPWMLPAWHRDPAGDREPVPGALPASPFALERQAPPLTITSGYTGMGSSPPVAPAPPEENIPDLDADLPDLPIPYIPDLPPVPVPAPMAVSPGSPVSVPAVSDADAGAGSTGIGAEVVSNGAAGARMSQRTNGSAAEPIEAVEPGAPSWERRPESAQGSPLGSPPREHTREQTVIELYLQGDLPWHKAAEFLGLPPEAFLDRVEQARRAQRERAK